MRRDHEKDHRIGDGCPEHGDPRCDDEIKSTPPSVDPMIGPESASQTDRRGINHDKMDEDAPRSGRNSYLLYLRYLGGSGLCRSGSTGLPFTHPNCCVGCCTSCCAVAVFRGCAVNSQVYR